MLVKMASKVHWTNDFLVSFGNIDDDGMREAAEVPSTKVCAVGSEGPRHGLRLSR